MEYTLYPEKYIHLHADCKVVPGAGRSAIYDLSCNEIVLLPNAYDEVLQQFKTCRIQELMSLYASETEREFLDELICFLDQNQMIILLDDTSCFPELSESWDFPGRIQNAVIDYKDTDHDLEKIIEQLDTLGCQHIQIRAFGPAFTLEKLSAAVPHLYHTAIKSAEVIILKERDIAITRYTAFMEEQPILASLTLHGDEEEKLITIDYNHKAKNNPGIEREIRRTRQKLSSALHCGKISSNLLSAPETALFMELKLYNGCLNRKIAIDTEGNIRNCPSMQVGYGNIKEQTLLQAVDQTAFREVWGVNKDKIDTCKVCEFRYACSDCRAYVEEPEDPYSKPLKCGYDPYQCTWEDWSSHPMKQKGILFYGMQTII